MSNNNSGCLSGLIKFILFVAIVVSGLAFGAKKLLFDYDGTYATDRITYSDEYGFTMLTTYHTQYQIKDSKGFAVVHIPLEALFEDESLWAKQNYNDIADSKETYETYSSWTIQLGRALGITGLKTAEIPNKGPYFIMEYKDIR